MKNTITLLITIILILGMSISQNSFAQGRQIQQNQQTIKDSKHKQWSDILSINHGTLQGDTKAFLQTESGKQIPILALKMPGMRKFGNVTLKRGTFKSMPKLQESLAKGKIMPRMRLIVYPPIEKGKEQQYYTVDLMNATVANIRAESTSNSASATIPTENFSLNFEEIKVVEVSKDRFGRKQKKMVYTN